MEYQEFPSRSGPYHSTNQAGGGTGDQPPSDARECAREGQRCAFSGTWDVWYGADSRWRRQRFTDGVDCRNESFGGDPAPGVQKACRTQAPASEWILEVWENGDFTGSRQQYRQVGVYRADQGGLNEVGDNRISAFKLKAGYKARFCDNPDGSGDCFEAVGPREEGVPINDRISYIRVDRHEPEWILEVWENGDFTGRSQRYTSPGTYRADQGGLNDVGNDSISAFRLKAGYRARFCDNPDGSGDCFEEAGPKESGVPINDRVSHIQISASAADSTPPAIQFLSPDSSATAEYTLTLRVTDGGSGVNWGSLAITKDGAAGGSLPEINGDQVTQSWTLKAGDNQFQVQVRDAAGNRAAQGLLVRYSPSPRWQVNPAALSFSGAAGGPAPAAQTLTLTNAGNGAGGFVVSASEPWVAAAPASGSLGPGASAALAVEVAPCTAPGTATAALVVSGGGSTATVSVQRACAEAPQAVLEAVPDRLDFQDTVGGGAPAPQRLRLRNVGTAAASFSVAVKQPWQQVSPSGGALAPGQEVELTVAVADCGRAGEEAAYFYVAGGPRQLAVLVRRACAGVERWEASPSALAFADAVGGGPAAPQVLTLFNRSSPGLPARAFSVSADQPWLRAAPAGGSVEPGQQAGVQVAVDDCAAVGARSAALTLRVEGHGELRVPVTLDCRADLVPPRPPAGLQLAMSSLGRVMLVWEEAEGAARYEFRATFDGQPLEVSGQAPARGSGSAGAVAQFVSAPEAPAKQGKTLCLAARSVNAAGASAYTPYACTAYTYYANAAARALPFALPAPASELPRLLLGR
ncbi:BACON domain-containing protein [Calidithermus terrae]|nr:hypothetical protein [Calidithermus terrae]